MQELGISDLGLQADIELLSGEPVGMDRTQGLAECFSQPRFVGNPIQVGTQMEIAFFQTGARLAPGDFAVTVDPSMSSRGSAHGR